MPNYDLLREIALLHTVVVVFIVMIFMALYRYVHREQFFRWWSWAFAAYGTSVFMSWISLHMGTDWDWRRFAIVAGVNTFALMQIPLTLRGTEAVRTGDKPGRFPVLIMGVVAIVLGVGLAPLSRMLADDRVLEYSLRTGPRHALLAVTFLYCSWVFFHVSRARSSRGALITSIACFLYAAVRTTWTVQLLPNVPTWDGNFLFYLDLVSILGIAFAAVVLMLERYGQARARLRLFEQILPTCSVCGIVRDDSGHAHGEGEWIELHEYMTRRTATQLSHTFCPNCIIQYKAEQGLT